MSPWTPKDRGPRPASLLFPPGPFAMRPRITEALADPDLRRFVPAATLLKDETRQRVLPAAFPPRADGADRVAELRRLAGQTRRETLAHLDHWLAVFTERATANGIIIHHAATAADARRIVVELAQRAGARRAVKAKSMVSEECQLLDALLEAGVETLETDLGELILQLDDDAPSHLVTPMIHKDRGAAARALSKLEPPDTNLPPDPSLLTARARAHLREWFATAELGLTGANFLVAETGEIVTCTNEGNGRLSAMCGQMHIAITGIEKIVADLDHLALLLELLSKSSTGQPLTVYTSFVAGPRRLPDAPDGPAEVHLVLVDNGRRRVLADDTFRDALGCIRCGACLNACPVYRTVGGHSYGSVWPGPIGQVLTPLMRPDAPSPDLPWASTLCGACRDACPVDIDLPKLLIAHRQRQHAQKATPTRLRLGLRLLRFAMGGRFRWRLAGLLARTLARREAGPTRAFAHGPRTLPRPADKPFRAVWKRMLDLKKRAR